MSTEAVPSPYSKLRLLSIAIICACGSLFNVGTVQSTKIAVPNIAKDLGIPPANLQWIPSSYALANGCFYLFFGRLGDVYGYKILFCVGMAWMAIWNIACGFAQNEVSIDLFRALEGMAPAAYVPASIGVMAQCFAPGRPRRLAFAIFTSAAGFGSLVGNMFGGYLTQRTAPSWRTSFYVIGAMAAVTAVAGIFAIPNGLDNISKDRRLDWFGVSLATSGLVLVIFCFSSAGTAPKGWNTPYIIALMVVGCVLLVLFCLWEYRLEKNPDGTPPLMRLSLFKSRLFSIVQLQGFVVYGAFIAFQFEVTLVLRNIQKIDPIGTTIRFIPTFCMGIFGGLVFAVVISRVRGNILFISGALFVAIANLLFAVLPYDASYWALGFPSFVLIICGVEIMYAVGTLYCTLIGRPDEQGMRAGIFYTMQSVGVSFALSIQSLIQSNTSRRHAKSLGVTPNPTLTNIPVASVIKGYRAAFWWLVALSLFAAIFALAMYDLGIVMRNNGQTMVDGKAVDVESSGSSDEKASSDKTSIKEKAAEGIPELRQS